MIHIKHRSARGTHSLTPVSFTLAPQSSGAEAEATSSHTDELHVAKKYQYPESFGNHKETQWQVSEQDRHCTNALSRHFPVQPKCRAKEET